MKLFQNTKNQEAYLFSIIQQSLPKTFLARFQELQSKMEMVTITASELVEMQIYTERIEAFDTEKLKALSELSKLKKVSFQQLVQELNAFPKRNE